MDIDVKSQPPSRRSAVFPWLAGFAIALLHSGCSSTENTEPCKDDAACADDEECVDEKCVPREKEGCTSTGCADGELCVNEECRSRCTAQTDCAEPNVCAVWKFEDDREEAICAPLEGRFTSCENDAGCDVDGGFGCVAGTCTTACRSHSDCASVGHCAVLEGGGTYCVAGIPAKPGGYFTRCPGGRTDCAADDGFICLSAGDGDLDSYCTTDCASDAQCPAGYRCGEVRVPPCGPACGVEGTDAPDCAPVSEIGAGRRYQCGVLSALRRVCERRSFCSPCERDEDCLGTPGQVCAKDRSGQRICTVPCDPNADSCPWGNAAECAVFDTQRGFATCSHRFGSCRGTGKGCEPCIDDSDCGDSGICSVFSFSRERFCVDLVTPCDCGTDADRNGVCLGHGCPETPGGLEMQCLTRAASDPLKDRCFGASVASGISSQQAGCWPRR
jgi:hypothetical protein